MKPFTMAATIIYLVLLTEFYQTHFVLGFYGAMYRYDIGIDLDCI